MAALIELNEQFPISVHYSAIRGLVAQYAYDVIPHTQENILVLKFYEVPIIFPGVLQLY